MYHECLEWNLKTKEMHWCILHKQLVSDSLNLLHLLCCFWMWGKVWKLLYFKYRDLGKFKTATPFPAQMCCLNLTVYLYFWNFLQNNKLKGRH